MSNNSGKGEPNKNSSGFLESNKKELTFIFIMFSIVGGICFYGYSNNDYSVKNSSQRSSSSSSQRSNSSNSWGDQYQRQEQKKWERFYDCMEKYRKSQIKTSWDKVLIEKGYIYKIYGNGTQCNIEKIRKLNQQYKDGDGGTFEFQIIDGYLIQWYKNKNGKVTRTEINSSYPWIR